MKNDDFFGGIFDFNGDGKTDISEQWIAFQIINDSIERNKEKNDEPRMTSKTFDDDTPSFHMPVNLEPTKSLFRKTKEKQVGKRLLPLLQLL